jgi:hypothetical protein
MKKYIIILFAFIGSFVDAQEFDFQELCLACAEAEGYYCGEYETLFDTIYNTIYETIIEYDTIVEIDYIQQTDTIIIYDNISDTLFIEIPVVEYDTIIEIQYEEIVEYIDCDSGLPCNSGMQEVIDKSLQNSVIYNIKGQAILTREGLYIEGGKIYYKTK